VTWNKLTVWAGAWKKISVWAGVVIIALAASGGIIFAVLVKQSPSFRQGLLANTENNIYETTGARVGVRDFNLKFFPLNLDLYGVVVRGNEPQFGEPLLHADHVGARIEIRSLWGHRWSLDEVVIDRPVVHLFVNQSGETNLPQPAKDNRSKTRMFDVAVRHLRLSGAEVDGTERKFLFHAELRDLHSTADFDPGLARYRGLLRYAEGTVKYDRYPPVLHSLDLSLDAVAAKLMVNRLNLATDRSRVALSGSVEGYSHPAVQASYDAHLATSDLATVLPNASLPEGVIHLVGTGSYRSDPGHATLETVALSGTVSSSSLAVTTPVLHTKVTDFGARYKLASGNAEVDDIHAQIFAGKMTGNLSIHDLVGASTAKFQARLKDASLDELQAAEQPSSTAEAQLSGQISGDVEATWNRMLKNLAGRGNVTLVGTLGRSPAAPLHAAIHADYADASQQLALRQSYIRTAQTSITVDGSVSEQSQLQVSLHSSNLHEVELLAQNFRIAPSAQPGQGLDLHGTGSFTGSVSGPASSPHLKGQLEASDLRVKGTQWNLLRTDVDASPSSLSFTNGSLEAGNHTSEKPQHPEPAQTTTTRSEGQISQSRDLATVK
jgi:translocation and assembly module TamB